jgi:hypothetical protein
MTGLLKDLMNDRADSLDAPMIDLIELTREGERRVRRRRGALAGGLVAASVLAVVAGGAALSMVPEQTLVADGTTASPDVLSWTEGSVLHREGHADVDLGVAPRAWVWAGDALVFTDADHRVRIWTGDALDVIGVTSRPVADVPELVSSRGYVAWVDDGGQVVRYDTATGERVISPDLPGDHSRVAAVDGAHVYVNSDAGSFGWQSTNDSWTTLQLEPGSEVADVESGVVVVTVPDRRAVVIRNSSRIEVPSDHFANLSPGGGVLSVEADDEGRLYDARTGDRLPFDTGHEWAVGYQWLTPEQLVVLAYDGTEASGDAASLLTCDVTTAACTDSGQSIGAVGDFQLPLGVHFSE